MSGRAKPGGEALLPNVPELTSIRDGFEVGSIQAGEVGAKGQRRQVTYRRARLALTLGLHLAGFFGNVGVLAAFTVAHEFHFLPALVLSWTVNAVICTWVAWKDPEITFLASFGIARLPFLFLVYGVLQYIQIKHMVDAYNRRTADLTQSAKAKRVEFHSKSFNGIVEGIPFAWLCLWSYFLIDPTIDCDWYMYVDMNDYIKLITFINMNMIRLLFLVAGGTSIITLSMGLLEVDYRVNESVKDTIDGSIMGTFFQWAYRFTEAGSRICGIVVLCLVFEPLAVTALNSTIGPLLIMPIYPAVWIMVYYLILASSKAKGAKRDHILAVSIMAFIMFFVNPFRFVDSPGSIIAARRINRALWIARIVEFVVALVMLGLMRPLTFPPNCHEDLEPRVLVMKHIMDHNALLPILWAVLLVLHSVVATFGPFHDKDLFRMGVLTDDTVLDMIPADADGESDEAAVAVRQSQARGISSMVLRVGTGITSQLFALEEQAFGNFVIEKVLGRGAYGVVVLVRMRNKKRGSAGERSMSDSPQDMVYAMKLQNTETRRAKNTNTSVLPSRETTADRERDIMRKLNHPFIIRLAFYFEVPDRALKDASSGEIITDSMNNARFQKAIVMEYCPGGDLDGYICERAFPPGYRKVSEMDAATAEWLQRARRLSAEMCVALAFLHEKAIVYRDLKPQNVLLKSGTDDDVHICFTDFGFSKDVSDAMSAAAGRLDSLAGTPLYAAPEIMAIAARQSRVEYTPAVDLFSLGKTICVMLWRVKLVDNPPELKMPSLEDCRGDARIHEAAWDLIRQLTSQTPAGRGRAADLESHEFFQSITLIDRSVLPALSWANLEKYGC